MSKSRSSDEKDREKDKDKDADVEVDKEKHGHKYSETEDDGNARAEREERIEEEEEDNARGQNVQLPMNRLQLTAETESNLKLSIFDSNSLMVKNEQAIPSSPPPSYEHVIEQKHKSLIVTYLIFVEFFTQSCYFDCEYDKNESDGGLGAGTPVFISEVMQGTACVLL
ncbi:uncharacterized protein LOC108623976 [Ceratina calcarata]|uniref:Uncharacterized protein LOC108623976 n=1 Tax=Ceratina calcarata TaxID=156304 RepID=A0AAJ7RZB3_9HYME|nr:uncharacterized protein LOC108623976 [Ceratina calcarata]